MYSICVTSFLKGDPFALVTLYRAQMVLQSQSRYRRNNTSPLHYFDKTFTISQND